MSVITFSRVTHTHIYPLKILQTHKHTDTKTPKAMSKLIDPCRPHLNV